MTTLDAPTRQTAGFAAMDASDGSDGHGSVCRCHLSRRGFLRGTLAAGATLAAPAWAQAPPKSPARRVDVHHHMLPPDYMSSRLSAGNIGAGADAISGWTPARSLEQMDQNGVLTAMISLSQPGIRYDDVAGTRSMLRYCNDYGAQMVREHPGRFGLFATIPLPDTEGSLREIEYAFDTLRADGIGLVTSYGDKWPGDPAFAPVLEELNRRKAVVFMHPNLPVCCSNLMPGIPGPTVEYQFNTARAIVSLLFTGTLTRFPDIRFIFCHAGGAMTPQVHRIIRTAEENKRIAEHLPNGALPEIRKLYYDTAQASYPENFGALKSFVPLSQILLGTDYPYVTQAQTIEPLLEYGLGAEDLAAVTRNNAIALFPRLGAA